MTADERRYSGGYQPTTEPENATPTPPSGGGSASGRRETIELARAIVKQRFQGKITALRRETLIAQASPEAQQVIDLIVSSLEELQTLIDVALLVEATR